MRLTEPPGQIEDAAGETLIGEEAGLTVIVIVVEPLPQVPVPVTV